MSTLYKANQVSLNIKEDIEAIFVIIHSRFYIFSGLKKLTNQNLIPKKPRELKKKY